MNSLGTMEIKFLPILFFAFLSCKSITAFDPNAALNYAVRQYTILSEQLANDDPQSGIIHTGDPLNLFWDKSALSTWTVGFYGGSLWTLYTLTGDNHWRTLAEEFQEVIKHRQHDTTNHDVGFIIYSTFGLCYEYTGNINVIPVIVQAAQSLSTRFHELSQCIRSWDNADWNGGPGYVKVIVDNMMNLQLLFKATELTGQTLFRTIAISHSNRTIEEHFRPDGGTYHVVAYNETTGGPDWKFTHQGLSDNSTWARGQAWAIHGFTTTYEETAGEFPIFLETAEKAANYFISKLPPDMIPYWDFDADLESGVYQPRDTSAAAIMADALLKLHKITGNPEYFTTAEAILDSLTTSFRSDGKEEYRIPSILVNGTVFFKEGNFDTAVVYADFYFLQAVKRYIELSGLK